MRWRRRRREKEGRKTDYLLIFTIGFLVLFGLAMLASASSNLGKVRFDDPYYYLKRQLMYGVALGLAGFIVGSRIHYRRYQRFALIFLLATVTLLILVFTPLGVHAKGATRWLAIGPITFQPSEFLKITFVLYLAAWLARDSERERSFTKGMVPLGITLGGISLLLLKQPSTSTVVLLMGTALVVYFVSGAKIRYLFGFSALAVMFLGIITVATPYRWERIQNFFSPAGDIERGGYHLNQAKIAIGSGGLTGVGFGQSTTKRRYLPEPVGDSIFAVVAEELGFIGSMVMIALFLFLVLRLFLLARRTRNKFGQLLLVGFGTVIALQTFTHIGAISGLIPLTGTPLPFVSYGGTALAVFMTMGGIAVNISKYS